jgi:hypothetical protein
VSDLKVQRSYMASMCSDPSAPACNSRISVVAHYDISAPNLYANQVKILRRHLLCEKYSTGILCACFFRNGASPASASIDAYFVLVVGNHLSLLITQTRQAQSWGETVTLIRTHKEAQVSGCKRGGTSRHAASPPRNIHPQSVAKHTALLPLG